MNIFTEEKIMQEQILYHIGELLTTESELIEDVNYARGEQNTLYLVLKTGQKLQLTIQAE